MPRVLIAIFLSLLVTSFCKANFKGFPRGCEAVGFGFEEHYVSLNQFEEQALFFIQNRSDTPITIRQRIDKPGFFSNPHHTKLTKNHWSGLALDQKDMPFNCLKNKKIIDCRSVIRLCQYPRARFSDSNGGNYWVAKNTSLKKTMQGAIKHGILLHW